MAENNHENNIDNANGEEQVEKKPINADEGTKEEIKNNHAGTSSTNESNKTLANNVNKPKTLTENSNEIVDLSKYNNIIKNTDTNGVDFKDSLNTNQIGNKSVKFAENLFTKSQEHLGLEENIISDESHMKIVVNVQDNLIRFRNIVLKVMESNLSTPNTDELRICDQTLSNHLLIDISSNSPLDNSVKSSSTTENRLEDNTPTVSKIFFENKETYNSNSLENISKQLSSSLEKTEKKSKTSIVTHNGTGAEQRNEIGTVGDNQTTRTEAHIVCECETSCAGAAVPVVVSFVAPDVPIQFPDVPDSISNETNESIIQNTQENDSITSPSENPNISNNTSDNTQHEPMDVNNNQQNYCSDVPYSQQETHGGSEQCAINSTRDTNSKSSVQKNKNSHDSSNVKKSLIPKLIRFGRRSQDSSLEARPKISSEGENLDSVSSHSSGHNTSSNIDSKLDIVQTELKATTSSLRQRLNIQSKKRASFLDKEFIDKEKSQVPETSKAKSQDASTDKNKLINEFYKSVTEIKKIAGVLSKNEDVQNQSQRETISNLYTNIIKIKDIANKFEDTDLNNEDQEMLPLTRSVQDQRPQKQTHLKMVTEAKSQDNKISIKVLPTKFNSKKKGASKVMELRTNLVHDSSLDIAELRSQASLVEHITYKEKKNVVKRSDSMDGIFIPSEPPTTTMEDEDEDGDGLDITITFKELKSAALEADSHLSVCFSDLSAEALSKLKRCPKNFTLRMDFASGKMVFHAERSAGSNSSLEDTPKNVEENVVDTKQSDMISLKPSTECPFTSQIIAVEDAQKKSSMSILKLTDPELCRYSRTEKEKAICFKEELEGLPAPTVSRKYNNALL